MYRGIGQAGLTHVPARHERRAADNAHAFRARSLPALQRHWPPTAQR